MTQYSRHHSLGHLVNGTIHIITPTLPGPDLLTSAKFHVDENWIMGQNASWDNPSLVPIVAAISVHTTIFGHECLHPPNILHLAPDVAVIILAAIRQMMSAVLP